MIERTASRIYQSLISYSCYCYQVKAGSRLPSTLHHQIGDPAPAARPDILSPCATCAWHGPAKQRPRSLLEFTDSKPNPSSSFSPLQLCPPAASKGAIDRFHGRLGLPSCSCERDRHYDRNRAPLVNKYSSSAPCWHQFSFPIAAIHWPWPSPLFPRMWLMSRVLALWRG